MSIAEKLQTIAENERRVYDAGYAKGQAEGGDTTAAYDEGFEAGKKAEYDAFWDSAQKNGTASINYYYAFANLEFWTQERIEKVKYKHLITNNLTATFNSNASITDLSMFSFEPPRRSDGTYDKVTTSFCFSSCYNLVKGMPINFDYLKKDNNPFNACYALQEFDVSGTIDFDGVNFSASKELNKSCTKNLINALSTTTEGLTISFSKIAVKKAFETSAGANDGDESAEWIALAGDPNADIDGIRPNWTISLL